MKYLVHICFLLLSLQVAAQCYHTLSVPKYSSGETLPIFTGVPNPEIQLDTILRYASRLISVTNLQTEGVKWVKKRVDANCLSPNPNDCMVWCLVKTDAYNYVSYDTIMEEVVVDTSQTKYFEYKTFDNIISFSHPYQEVACVCEADMSKKMIKKVKKALRDFDYYYASLDHTFSDELKAVLMEFQRDYSLPVGYLDEKTLEYLEVKWPYK